MSWHVDQTDARIFTRSRHVSTGAAGQVARLTVRLLHPRHRDVHVYPAEEPAPALHAGRRNLYAR